MNTVPRISTERCSTSRTCDRNRIIGISEIDMCGTVVDHQSQTSEREKKEASLLTCDDVNIRNVFH